MHHARIALINRDYQSAREFADRISEDSPHWNEAQLIAGEACSLLEDYVGAISHYSALPHDGSPDSVQAAFALGEIYRTVGFLTKSEQEYRYVLQHEPSPAVHERIAFLLALTRRLWEARPHYLALVQSGEWTLKNLGILADLERPLEHGEYLAECARRAPEDVSVQMGLAAFNLYSEGDSEIAIPILRKVVAESPDNLAAQAMLGESLLNSDESAFPAWHSQLPKNADESAEIWFVRGLWARRERKLEFAARCFWETARKVPVHRRANYQLGQVLEMLGHPASKEFAALAGRQFQLTQYLDDALEAEGHNEAALKGIVEIMEQSGRYWEGVAWARTAGEFYPNANWPRLAFSRMQPLLGQSPQAIAESQIALKYDLSRYPATDEDLSREPSSREAPANALAMSRIRFHHETQIGLDFVYFNGDDPSTPGVRMFEQSGGGIAVLDLDSDRWPDLYFTQGAEWIQGENAPRESPEFADQIFRNIDGKSFVNVTQIAGLGSRGFGQGAAVGDFNADGFPDLYVANVGQNRLYQNNGDGTFRDLTEESGLHLPGWTSSCLMADLNADGLPDLFDVTYLTGPEVYTIICQKKGCSPSVFEGVPDRLFINKGDGTFEWIEGATPRTDSKGLGILAFDLDERNRPSLFVANDQVPNHFLRNHPSDDDINIRLEDQAFLSGLGHNMNGLAMACMGIASEDVNHDGLLDLFVTNFKSEPNTLYIQDVEGLFIDRTNLSGLYHPSLPMTGWGTQFFDADLDGSPDLVVANGHVYPEEETDYRMKAQFFRSDGEGHFAELPSEALGPYFEKKHAGRSLARLDWNRDGLIDFVVSNINEPAALLTNATETEGHFLGVRLSATKTARDAIGAVVEVDAHGRRWKKQLVAGDGFQASNERLLHFGLGPDDVASSLVVTWPSGARTKVKDLPVDGVLDLVEGIAATFVRGRHLESIAVEHIGLP